MLFPRSSKILILALLGLCTSAMADSFRVVSLSQISGLTSLHFQENGEPQTLPVSISNFSQPFNIPATRQLSLYAKPPQPDVEQTPVLTIQFPEKSGDVIVLLKATRSGGASAYRYEILDDSASAFPSGSVYICNFMQEPVIIRLGKKQVLVESNDRNVVALTSSDKPFNDGVAFAAEINGHGRVFSTSSWYLAPSMKIFCVLYQDDRGNPQIRRIRLT
ncbi:hypothetical protein [Cerasicoccus frondis]|uniref:hypothetical protein n=1 Tax=Cerasicoccus frondis TaxID=490090 RepID=UPI00285296FE|nr:hypothetical protein [Cerasicoccus frondis]